MIRKFLKISLDKTDQYTEIVACMPASCQAIIEKVNHIGGHVTPMPVTSVKHELEQGEGFAVGVYIHDPVNIVVDEYRQLMARDWQTHFSQKVGVACFCEPIPI